MLVDVYFFLNTFLNTITKVDYRIGLKQYVNNTMSLGNNTSVYRF